MGESVDLASRLELRRGQIDLALDRRLPTRRGPESKLADAMRYAVLAGGKRLRPILALEACAACGGDDELLLDAACGLELVHTYSLIHDDLPAMDDDDLRRGSPTVHRVWDEATAILAGDALLSLGLEWIAEYPAGDERVRQRLESVLVVTRAAGIDGMVGGQISDLAFEGVAVDLETRLAIHDRKTGALFRAAAELGAIHADADERSRRALVDYAGRLGLAFQIADDVLDRTATAEQLGKTPGKDARAGKATIPDLIGESGAIDRARDEAQRACATLDAAGLLTPFLEALARHAVGRRR